MQITDNLHNGFLLLPLKPCALFYLIMKKKAKDEKVERMLHRALLELRVAVSRNTHSHAAS